MFQLQNSIYLTLNIKGKDFKICVPAYCDENKVTLKYKDATRQVKQFMDKRKINQINQLALLYVAKVYKELWDIFENYMTCS